MLYIYLLSFIILFIILTIFCNLYDSEYFEDYDSLFSSQHYIDYISSISPDIYPSKVLFSSNIDFNEQYRSRIKKVDNKFVTMLNEYLKKSKKLLETYKVFDKPSWQIRMSINNLENNYPYTLDETIIIPFTLLNDYYQIYKYTNNLSDTFLETLIHEMIHIIQRKNQTKFNDFYRKNYIFLGKMINDNELPNELKKKYFTNPDSNNTIWYYNIDGYTYIPICELDSNKNISQIGYKITNIDETIDLSRNTTLKKYNASSLYHPNEIFACSVSKSIIKGDISNNVNTFLNML